MLRAIALKKWKTASNIIFKHGNIIEHVPDALRRKISAEFHDLSSDSLLKGIFPEEITAFNNGILVKEISVKCPLWHSAVNGACGLLLHQSDEKRKRATNVIAVATSVLAKFRNPCLSALAYSLNGVISWRC